MRKHGISKTKGDRVLTALFYVLLTLFSLLCLYPLMLAFAVAFSSEQAVSANGFSIIPQDPSLDTFRYLLSQKMNILIQGYGMTTLITLVGYVLLFDHHADVCLFHQYAWFSSCQQIFIFRLFHHVV